MAAPMAVNIRFNPKMPCDLANIDRFSFGGRAESVANNDADG